MIGDPPVLQERELRRGERELLGELARLNPNLLADLAESVLDRHSRFNTDQQQVHRVRKGATHFCLPLRDRVREKELRRLHAKIGRANRDRRLDRKAQAKIVDHGQVKHDGRHERDRPDKAKEQKCRLRRRAAITGESQLCLRVLRA